MLRWPTALSAANPAVHRWAWVLTLCFFLVGDVITTAIGISTTGVTEVNAFLATQIASHGVGAMLLLKVVLLSGSYLVWRALPDEQAIAIPVGFAIVGVGVTGWNLVVVGISL
ncbi:DUF5658 family protein [Halodesulfurarchaeum formicicum]|uniref:DUF5658 domain-containing protein n=1 Tax=Halodesulfurarchaeum formicicum TaxID=1873524 RepID=A0A1J1AAI5_9EURY|nr:DUF5658 family protein [Halodesulfurarchaeum formicicum]APE94577.1 hypothetical protein HSR6_0101 [Halodesulfurarchaeum formicicum]